MQHYHLGIDIGGTKTAIGIYNGSFVKAAAVTIPTQPGKGGTDLVKRIAFSVKALLLENGIDKEQLVSAGAASPGPVDLYTGTVIHIPTMGFRNVKLADMLSDALGIRFYLEKDTNAAVLCESVFGVGKAYNTVTYITVSTGIGSATAINKKVLWGGSCAAGELGHLTVERDGLQCPCGKKGCLEQYASGTGIARISGERYGREMTAKEVFALAANGEKIAKEVIEKAADYLGFAIAAVYQLLDPDIIVLGGSVTKDYDILRLYLESSLNRYIESVEGRKFNIQYPVLMVSRECSVRHITECNAVNK